MFVVLSRVWYIQEEVIVSNYNKDRTVQLSGTTLCVSCFPESKVPSLYEAEYNWT